MNVLVTGGTGAVGRHVVRRLRESGHQATVMSRRPQVPESRRADLATGEGLAEAVAGMEAIVHAGSAAAEFTKIKATDVEGTRRLLDAARAAGVGHLVYISIVGMEGVAHPYYRAKLAAEAHVKSGTVPWTILRATQFHTLMEIFLGTFARLPGLMPVPYRWQFQPVDASEVGARLAQLAVAPPAGLLPDFGGPEVREFKSLAESWRRARGLRKPMFNLPLPFEASRQFAAGKLLCPDHRDGRITFEEYLERRYPPKG
ncbi:MAG: NAD(P)H-binding protein [Candidatus Dormibacteraeota bacterium]|nr:NAD(P)H-binding protein [Candidatus Dormibacteraeota bacterium]